MRMGRPEYDYNLPVRNRLSDQDIMSSMKTANSTVKEAGGRVCPARSSQQSLKALPEAALTSAVSHQAGSWTCHNVKEGIVVWSAPGTHH